MQICFMSPLCHCLSVVYCFISHILNICRRVDSLAKVFQPLELFLNLFILFFLNVLLCFKGKLQSAAQCSSKQCKCVRWRGNYATIAATNLLRVCLYKVMHA